MRRIKNSINIWMKKRGKVCVEIEGTEILRVLNICMNQNIVLYDIKWIDKKKIVFNLSLIDFYILCRIRKKVPYKIHILNKTGIPFIIEKLKNKAGFLLGIVVAFFIMMILSSKIWSIQIVGNYEYTKQQILDYLSEKGIKRGVSKVKIDCILLSENIRKDYLNIAWVSSKITGTCLVINIKEGITDSKKKETGLKSDIICPVDGKIVKMITRKGCAIKKTGDECKTGETIVKGEITIKNDNNDIVRTEYVCADADVFIMYTLFYYDKLQMLEEEKIYLKPDHRWALQLKDHYIGFQDIIRKNTISIVEDYSWDIINELFFTLSIKKISYYPYESRKKKLSKEEAIHLSQEKEKIYIQNLLKKGVQIFENNVKIEVDYPVCISSGKITVIENITYNMK